MSGSDTLAQALADVNEKRAALEVEYERMGAELAKLRQAEKALRAIVENVPLDTAGTGAGSGGEARTAGRGSRGPRANSAKGRLKVLLDGSGPQGLSTAQITRALSDVAPGTINTYLSMMVTSGEAIRRGDFYTSGQPERSATGADGEPDEAEDGAEEDGADA